MELHRRKCFGGYDNNSRPLTLKYGTTYLPMRTVAEALGLETNWDSGTGTVILGEMLMPNQSGA